jgi:hypothetical protein
VGPKAESAVRVMAGAREALDRVPGPCGSSHAGVLLEGVRKGCRSAQKACRRHAEDMQKADPQRTPQRTWECGPWTRAAKGVWSQVRSLPDGDLCRETCVEGLVSSVERRVSSLPKKDQTQQQLTATPPTPSR